MTKTSQKSRERDEFPPEADQPRAEKTQKYFYLQTADGRGCIFNILIN